MQTKICTKCGQELPATSEYFYKDKTHKDGLVSFCKNCKEQYHKQYRQENKEKKSEYDKQYCQINKDKVKESQKQKYIKNIEKRKRYSRQRYKEKSEEIKEYWKQCRRQNPEKFRIRAQKRKAMQKGLVSNYNSKTWETLKQYFSNKCAYCGKEKKLSQDHFVPLVNGGEYTCNNIIPACQSCNSSKQGTDFFEWYPKQESYSKKREQKILKYLNYRNGIQQLSLII